MHPVNGMTRVIWRVLLFTVGAWLILMAAGYLPTKALIGGDGVKAMLLAQAVVFGAVCLTLLLSMKQMLGQSPEVRFRIMLKAGLVRFAGTLAVAVLFALRGVAHTAGFLIWVAIAYVVMIKVETLVLLYWNKQLENRK